jgi:hypothetical protein
MQTAQLTPVCSNSSAVDSQQCHCELEDLNRPLGDTLKKYRSRMEALKVKLQWDIFSTLERMPMEFQFLNAQQQAEQFKKIRAIWTHQFTSIRQKIEDIETEIIRNELAFVRGDLSDFRELLDEFVEARRNPENCQDAELLELSQSREYFKIITTLRKKIAELEIADEELTCKYLSKYLATIGVRLVKVCV